MHGNVGGETGVDDEMAAKSFDRIGASIMGRWPAAPSLGGPYRGQNLPTSPGRCTLCRLSGGTRGFRQPFAFADQCP
jgi:hypothetical protein